jgi:hypothetical protein
MAAGEVTGQPAFENQYSGASCGAQLSGASKAPKNCRRGCRYIALFCLLQVGQALPRMYRNGATRKPGNHLF